ncbi:MAG: methylated-DNA--[protein]-cysteine S-methyltransferase [Oscillospiraceae bacterium]|nr:methylated-DNA--[protein]-cysteine S-methyltransferase [Oscillospiraceae bacterium]
MTYTYKYKSPLGDMTMSSDGENLTGLWFDDQKHFAVNIKGEREGKLLPVFETTIRWLDIYYDGAEPDFMPPTKMVSTPFRHIVWEILKTIPYGETMTYGEIAKIAAEKCGKKTMSAQAVGGAVGHNFISVIVPCHRVVGTDGSLTGYAGGIDKKIRLLNIEKADMSKLYVPKKGTAL